VNFEKLTALSPDHLKLPTRNIILRVSKIILLSRSNCNKLTTNARTSELKTGQYSDNVIRVNQAVGDRELIKEISRNLAAGGNKLSR